MFNRLRTLVNEAVEVVAPSFKSDLDLLRDHWNYVAASCEKNEDNAIEETNIAFHLDQIIKYIKNEETTEFTGPCLTFILEHKVPETLVKFATENKPKGMTLQALKSFSLLISNIHSRLLPEATVHVPVRKLINLCHSLRPSESTLEIKYNLVVLLNVILRQLKLSPALLNLFITQDSFPFLAYLFDYVSYTDKETYKIARESVIIGLSLLHRSKHSYFNPSIDILFQKFMTIYQSTVDSSEADTTGEVYDYYAFIIGLSFEINTDKYLIERLEAEVWSEILKNFSDDYVIEVTTGLIKLSAANHRILEVVLPLVFSKLHLIFKKVTCLPCLKLFDAILNSKSSLGYNYLVLKDLPEIQDDNYNFNKIQYFQELCDKSRLNKQISSQKDFYSEKFDKNFLDTLEQAFQVWKSRQSDSFNFKLSESEDHLNFLDLVLSLMETFTENDFRVNLVLTGLVGKILLIPDIGLHKYLFSDLSDKGYNSLIDIMNKISNEIHTFLQDNEPKIDILKDVPYEELMKKVGFITESSTVEEIEVIMAEQVVDLDKTSDFGRLLINSIVFENFCSEIGLICFIVGKNCEIKSKIHQKETGVLDEQ